MSPILPGSTIGLFGGGQLGRMTAMAARGLGYHIVALDPDPSCAARFVVDRTLTAAFDDATAGAALGAASDVVSLEIESIALPALEAASRHAPVRPNGDVLGIVQDRGVQRRWLAQHGFPTGPFRVVSHATELAPAAADLGSELFVKSCQGGYDGRSQVRVRSADALPAAFASLGHRPCVLETALPLDGELSVLVARRPSGEVAVYPPAFNHHDNRILTWSVLPAPIAPALAQQAQELGRAIASALAIEGLLVIELFLVGGTLLVNELAPRPHNSFHMTEVGAYTSQFEQHVRAVCDLPLGSAAVHTPAAIVNLLGDLWAHTPAFDRALALPGIRLHLYGKRVARSGRKMGHLSAVGSTPEDAVARVMAGHAALQASSPIAPDATGPGPRAST